MNVLLVCSMGASTASMCKRIDAAAAAEGMELTTTAVPMAMMGDKIDWADVVLIGPQIRFMLEKVSASAKGKPVEAIDMMAYGTMDGAKVLAQIKGMI
ncbi:PTS sugar transporter subunit IIB [Collinsella provencensis]|uniref:PTS sugar transporter subunit IIB n=1 Tax=Collinsella provencensis TaxID=1937461 RepID=UPI000C83705A|nr:PTS sugar transporter subunit IIB [Collinsella provencensis]